MFVSISHFNAMNPSYINTDKKRILKLGHRTLRSPPWPFCTNSTNCTNCTKRTTFNIPAPTYNTIDCSTRQVDSDSNATRKVMIGPYCTKCTNSTKSSTHLYKKESIEDFEGPELIFRQNSLMCQMEVKILVPSKLNFWPLCTIKSYT